MIIRIFCGLLAASVAVCTSVSAVADAFGTGDLAFELPFVAIGAPGNTADTTGAPNPAGSVGYAYAIGKYEVPEDAIRKANELSALAGNPLGITIDDRGPNKPATSVSWYEAARFVNWLNAEVGAPHAYRFDQTGAWQLWEPGQPGFNPDNRFRNDLARYALPSIDEWYKAAYYDSQAGRYWDFPTGSDTTPVPVASGRDPGTAVWNQTTGPADVDAAGGQSAFGAVGMGGNVGEWQEGPRSGVTTLPEPDFRLRRGDEWGLAISGSGLSSLAIGLERMAASENPSIGFRVVRIPEPDMQILFLLLVAIIVAAGRARYSVQVNS